MLVFDGNGECASVHVYVRSECYVFFRCGRTPCRRGLQLALFVGAFDGGVVADGVGGVDACVGVDDVIAGGLGDAEGEVCLYVLLCGVMAVEFCP